MTNRLKNKVVLLTGGATGIGRECALAYGREGATVAVLDRNLDDAKTTAEQTGNNSLALQVDVSDGSAVGAAITTVLEKLGRLDAIHNNAGIVGPTRPLHETSE